MSKTILSERTNQYVENTSLKTRNLIFTDIEFTGLEMYHEILQIGCVVVSQPDFKVVSEWKVNVLPTHIEDADPKALEVIKYSERGFDKDAVPLKEALEKFNEVSKDGVLVGYNVVWDFLFLKKSYNESQIKPAFHWQVLDVMSMTFAKMYNSDIKGFRMMEVGEALGIENGKWHDALEDAKATYDFFVRIMQK